MAWPTAKLCQFCRLAVPWEATVCPHCTRDIDTVDAIRMRTKEFALAEAERQRRRSQIAMFIIGVPLSMMLVAALLMLAIGGAGK